MRPPKASFRGNQHDGMHFAAKASRLRFDVVPDSLNSRFLPLPELATTAVFAVDDDIRVSCSDLKFAFSVWASAQRTLVGFYPRLHVRITGKEEKTPLFDYHSWWYVWWTGRYSIILTKAALFHRDYLDKYSAEMPAVVRKYVDEKMNCGKTLISTVRVSSIIFCALVFFYFVLLHVSMFPHVFFSLQSSIAEHSFEPLSRL